MQDTFNSPTSSSSPRSSRRVALRTVVAGATLVGALTVLAVWAVGIAGPGSSSAGTGGQTRVSEAASVTLEVTWAGPEAGPTFTVKMDTHSVDLDGFDLSELAVLRTDTGVEVSPESWEAPKGGHHREGVLRFPAEADGRPLLGDDVRGLTLVVRSVAVPERSFEWTW